MKPETGRSNRDASSQRAGRPFVLSQSGSALLGCQASPRWAARRIAARLCPQDAYLLWKVPSIRSSRGPAYSMEPSLGLVRVYSVDTRCLHERGLSVAAQEVSTGQLRQSRFEDFYRLHRDGLARALSLTLRDPHLGAEAADEAMARAYQRWGTVRYYDNPVGWTYRVGLHWARSWLRKRRREVPESTGEPAVWDANPFDPILARQIGSLSDHHRSVIVLRFFWDWPIERIAAALDVRPGTVKSRLHRALGELRSIQEVSR